MPRPRITRQFVPRHFSSQIPTDAAWPPVRSRQTVAPGPSRGRCRRPRRTGTRRSQRCASANRNPNVTTAFNPVSATNCAAYCGISTGIATTRVCPHSSLAIRLAESKQCEQAGLKKNKKYFPCARLYGRPPTKMLAGALMPLCRTSFTPYETSAKTATAPAITTMLRSCPRCRPHTRHQRQPQHRQVAQEELRPHRALDPGEATAIGAAQRAVIDGEIAHERDQQDSDEDRAPTPEPRHQNQHRAQRLGNPDRQRQRHAQRAGSISSVMRCAQPWVS